MTTPEITSLIQRLMSRTLIPGELAALTTRDLDDINAYLAACAEVGSATRSYRTGVVSATFRPRPVAAQPRRTYTEAELLAEFGVRF